MSEKDVEVSPQKTYSLRRFVVNLWLDEKDENGKVLRELGDGVLSPRVFYDADDLRAYADEFEVFLQKFAQAQQPSAE